MTVRRILCICMALVLALGCAAALAEDEDLQVQLDAANARIAELEEQVDTYYPFYMAQIVARFGDHIIWLDDVQAEYEAVAAQYESMGLSLVAYGLEDSVKMDIVNTIVENAVLFAKAAELELDQFDEETEAGFETEAQNLLDQYIDYYIENVYPGVEEVTDEMRAEAAYYWEYNGMGLEGLTQSLRESAILDAVHEYAIQNVTFTEEDIQAAYDALVLKNQESYTDDRTYNSDRTSGVAIAWNPEGYRAVKHVLILFSDEQAEQYYDLRIQLSSLEMERDAILNPAEEDAEADDEAAEPRALEDVEADIEACQAEIDALYAELLPTAEEVIEAFNDGADFDELIAEYNEDPGMTREPTASQGYAVSANSTYWDPAFTEGAMSIENVGEISGPVYGSNGIHIIYYMADIEPGEVGLEAIRDSIATDAEEEKINATYDAQVAAWLEEAGVEYFYENFGITVQ